jgi:repressor LexA
LIATVTVSTLSLASVRQQTIAEKGETVIAVIDGEATVKTLRYADGRVWLMPQNPVSKPISAEEGILPGKVVSVLRCL